MQTSGLTSPAAIFFQKNLRNKLRCGVRADRTTGTVFAVGGFASHFPPDSARGPDLQWIFELRPDSSPLIAHGCRFEDERVCGAFYFEMTGRGAKLIRSIAFKPAPAKRP